MTIVLRNNQHWYYNLQFLSFSCKCYNLNEGLSGQNMFMKLINWPLSCLTWDTHVPVFLMHVSSWLDVPPVWISYVLGRFLTCHVFPTWPTSKACWCFIGLTCRGHAGKLSVDTLENFWDMAHGVSNKFNWFFLEWDTSSTRHGHVGTWQGWICNIF